MVSKEVGLSWLRSNSIPRAFWILLFTATLSCGGAKPEEGKATETTCPSTQTLTYANFGKSFMQTYCLRCHSSAVSGEARKGAPDDHNLDNVADIKAQAEHLDELAGSGPAATNTVMPKDDPRPSADERRKLSEWLACGAP